MLPSGNTRLVYIQGQTGFSTSGRARVLKKYFGLGRVGYRVFVSNTNSIGYYRVLKTWLGIRRVSPSFPILSNIWYLIYSNLYTAPLLWRENVMVASTKSKIKVNFSREETDCFQIEFYFQRQLCRAQSALEKQQMLGALGMRLLLHQPVAFLWSTHKVIFFTSVPCA